MILDFEDILAKPERQRTIVSERAGRDRRQVRRRPAHPDRVLRRRHVDGGPHPRGGRGRHDHPRRLRQAHPGRPVPLAGPRRQGRARRPAARRRHGRPLLHHDVAPLAAVLHQPRPGLPRQGLRAAGLRPRRQGPARRQPAGVPARTSRSPRSSTCATTRSSPTSCSPPGTAWSRRPGSASTTPRARGGLIAINLQATATSWSARTSRRSTDDLLLVSRKAPVGALPRDRRASCGRWAGRPAASPGMKFRGDDSLLSL